MKAAKMALLVLGYSGILCGGDDWVDVVHNVAIRVQPVLYEKKGHPNFFIRVELQNQTSRDIGVDLSEKWMVVYPNQWGGSERNRRDVISERSLIPKKLDAQLRARLIDAFRSKRLTMLPPGKNVDYYTNFNASGRKDVEAAAGKFILVSIKGQLWFTDGANVWDDQPGFDRDLVIQKPVKWAIVPENAIVIER